MKKKIEPADKIKTYYHGTSYENGINIIKNNFNPKYTNWNCCSGKETYFYKETIDCSKEESIKNALGNALIASAICDSKNQDVFIFRIEVTDELYISEDYSCDNMNNIAVTINNNDLNKGIEHGTIKLTLFHVKNIYNPLMRFFYIASLDDYLLNIDKFTKLEMDTFTLVKNNGLYESVSEYLIDEPIENAIENHAFISRNEFLKDNKMSATLNKSTKDCFDFNL